MMDLKCTCEVVYIIGTEEYTELSCTLLIL